MAKYSWPEKPVLIGTPVKRLDGPDKVTGRARYTYDINRPGMIYGKMVRSPYPHARVVSIDLSAAEKAPGVKAVLAYAQPGAQVMYQGDPVAAVAADTEERALDAARMVRVRYEVLPHFATVEQAMAADAPAVFPNGNTRQGADGRDRRPRRRLRQRRPRRRGDVLDARHRPRLSRDARHRVRVGRRQADGVGLDPGGDPERPGICPGRSASRRPTSTPSRSTWAAASAASSPPTRRASSARSWRSWRSCRSS